MKLLAVVFLAAFVTVSLTQEAGSTTDKTTTIAPPTPTSSTPAPTPVPTSSTTPPTPPTSTTTKPAPTTRAPTTSAPTTSAPTTSAPTSTTPAPKPEEPTLSNYTLLNKDKKVCAVVITKVVATQNATSYPFVNGTLVDKDSICNETQATLFIESVDGYTLQIVIETDGKTFFVRQLSVDAAGLVASQENLRQFDTPKEQYYKCAGANQVSLKEHDVELIFSDMKYQAFRNPDTADFVGSEFECVSDYHSDVVIIAIGCALALLVVVILVAYLIARRRNRQRGYQSV